MGEYLEQKNVMLRKIVQEKSSTCWNLITLLCEWKVSLSVFKFCLFQPLDV